ncbi:MAG: DUF3795 domain-containing protein [bacterium]|nr:DUF3795 domain-containing protein [bacterium]
MKRSKEELISYCGLYCGECFIKENRMADLSVELRKYLDKVNFKKYTNSLSKMIPEMRLLRHYGLFYKVLCALDGMRCPAHCRANAGTSMCKVRKCCRDKELKGCWECAVFETCKTLAWLKPVNKDANLKNLRIIKRKGAQTFLKEKKYW